MRHQGDAVQVAAVCGSEARIYGLPAGNGRRPLLRVVKCASYGAALMYANDFDEKQRKP